MATGPGNGGELLDAFRSHYHRFQTSVTAITQNPTDSVVIARLGDDLDEYARLVQEHSGIFNPAEFALIQTSRPGRPPIGIDPDFLRWAYSQRSTASVHRFLGVSRSTVRSALLRHDIATPQANPFPTRTTSLDDTPLANPVQDDLLDPDLPIPAQLPSDVEDMAATDAPISSYTGPLSDLSDEDLDILLLRLRSHFRRAGLAMLDGMLRRLGHRVQRERVRQSLLRIDPVHRIFERIRIRRRIYSVAGPNSLWHHDGQHGMNFFSFCHPFRPLNVHNVRIERLWVDITAQLGATWSERFTLLELRHGLDINNIAHIWLLHFLFLATINSQLAFFAQSWNQHRIQIRHGPNRSPSDMFVFDMLVNGVRGNQLPPEEEMDEEELEVYGIDWAGLQDDTLLASQRANNSMGEGATSWVGRVGPPPLADLSSVVVEPPAGVFEDGEDVGLYNAVVHLLGSADDEDCVSLWTHALAYVRSIRPDIF
ncbi:hypothetical protein C8F04DRAFT_973698 [Mycena alexandri]|uniref:Integrase core domain-containing protein n=1 Tax=Mycena alexandri TaxID=1745969 RepID=A0AAD6S5C5_9AGAR|nr:hypothetical protein C8F04DRAFT_973698 [Mycena alexandri]